LVGITTSTRIFQRDDTSSILSYTYNNDFFQLNLERKLGSGGYGTVYQGKLWEGGAGKPPERGAEKFVAIKLAEHGDAATGNLLMQTHGPTDPSIAKVWHVIKSLRVPQHNKIYQLVMLQYVHGMTMRDFIKQGGYKAHPELRNKHCLQLARAIALLHHRNIAHGDLKPQNIMITYETFDLVLVDFDLAFLTQASVVIGQTAQMMEPLVSDEDRTPRRYVFYAPGKPTLDTF
jgi:serine/threonine protein kinase